ncbi:MAG: glutamate racemase, partial [Pedobacter sp.]
HRVLGVIRPTAEVIGNFTNTKNVGVMGTRGTVNSNSYPIEINHFFPEVKVHQQACPMWVPIIENNEHLNEGADYFVDKYIKQLLAQANNIDCILLACTHYPLLIPKIEQYLPTNMRLLAQGDIVADSLVDYLQRHQEIEVKLGKNATKTYYTSGDVKAFDNHASLFLGEEIAAKKMIL